MKIKYKNQITGNTCGPTCLYMVARYCANYPNDLPFVLEIKHTVEDIAKMCGTDWEVGTPPDRMEKGMEALGIKYVEYISSPKPFEHLKQVINSGNVPILRTITKSIPHWIIINDYNKKKNVFNVLDPWLGILKYTEKELDDIWNLRNYQFFEVVVSKSKIKDLPEWRNTQ